MRDRERERESKTRSERQSKGPALSPSFRASNFVISGLFSNSAEWNKVFSMPNRIWRGRSSEKTHEIKKGKANRDILHLLFLFSFSSFRESKIKRESKRGVREEEIVELMFFYVSPRLLARFFLFAVCFRTPVDGIMFLPRQTESGSDGALIRPN